MNHGDFTHVEIPADDAGRAKRFYAELFGWQFQDVPGFPDYHMFTTAAGQDGVGGAIARRSDLASARMLAYIDVDSLDEALLRVAELGGSVAGEKREVPGMGWYAVIADSEGNEIALWESASRG
jgi:predicted enzyme related to lactoylglutathione lyase